MAVRRKSLVIVILTVTCLIAVIYASSRMTVLAGFVKLEEEFTRRRVRGALAELQEKIDILSDKASDWAEWDDAYAFINDGNKEFIKSNLLEQTFLSLKINLIVFADTTGKIVWGQGFDLAKKMPAPLPERLSPYLVKNRVFSRHFSDKRPVSGLLMLPEGPLLIVARPILTSQREGPVRGTLIFGRFLDSSLIMDSTRLSTLTLAFYKIADQRVPEEVRSPAFLFSKAEAIDIKPLSETLLAAYAPVKDIFGNPVLIMELTVSREIYLRGRNALHYFFITLILFGFVFAGVFILPLENEIVKRERSEERLARLNESFLGFGVEPSENIKQLTRLCGELMGASFVWYSRFQENMLCALSQWNAPADFTYTDRPDGRIAYEVIKKGGENVVVMRDLQKSGYAETDPHVRAYDLHTYVGIPVKFGSSYLGSLNAVYRHDFSPTVEEKRIVSIVGTAIGVEETRWQADNLLKLSEERYKKITSTVSDYMYSVFLENNVAVRTDYGPMCAMVTGYTEKEFLDNPLLWIDIVPQEEQQMVKEHVRQIYAFQNPDPIEHRNIRKDGMIRWIRNTVVPHYDHLGNLTSYDGLIADITERKRAEEALLESERKLETLLSNLPGMAYRCRDDADLTMEFISDGSMDLIGYHPTELVEGRLVSYRNLIHPGERQAVKDGVLQAVKDKQPYRLMYRIMTSGREEKWVWEQGRGVFSEDGRLLGVEGFITDITERKRAEKILTESKQQAEIASRLKSAFLANMSHEIRTPLNAIIGFAELMENTSLDYVQKDYIGVIKDSGQILLALINDILDLSKIEAGEMHLEIIDFDLEYLLRSVLKINSTRVEEKGLDLSCDIDERLPRWFKGDPTRIRQILINLVSNAIKFTDRGGITVSAGLKETVEKDGARVHIIQFSVRDTGIGIPKDKHQIIFEAFEQGDVSTTRKYGGTGLGLTICRALVTMMGGTIWVESEPGKGSEFLFTVRLAEAAPAAEKDINPLTREALKDKKVALVDDNPASRKITEYYCLEAGMRVVYQGQTAEDALSWLKEQAEMPDLIITDVMMPGMNGYDFAREAKKIERAGTVKMIAITSDARPGAARIAQESGFDAYVPRPVTKANFVKVVETTLGDKRSGGAQDQIVTRHLTEELVCKGLKVLVAEDNAVNQKLLQIVLTQLGCESEIASNGRVAVEKVKSGHFDLVLMDLQMPVMGGCEAARVIRAEVSRTLPIVALTAAAMKEDETSSLEAGMNDFITKPVELHKLKEKIVHWTGKDKPCPRE
jgi:PAS domain S-box-containing protein